MEFSEIKEQAKTIIKHIKTLKEEHGLLFNEIEKLLKFGNSPSFSRFKGKFLPAISNHEFTSGNDLDYEISLIAKDCKYSLTYEIYKQFGSFIETLENRIKDFEKDTNEIVKDLKGFDLWKDYKANLFINFIKATPNELSEIEGVYFIYRNADRFSKTKMTRRTSRIQKLPLRIQKSSEHNVLEAELKVIRLAPDNSSFAQSLYSGVVYFLDGVLVIDLVSVDSYYNFTESEHVEYPFKTEEEKLEYALKNGKDPNYSTLRFLFKLSEKNKKEGTLPKRINGNYQEFHLLNFEPYSRLENFVPHFFDRASMEKVGETVRIDYFEDFSVKIELANDSRIYDDKITSWLLPKND